MPLADLHHLIGRHGVDITVWQMSVRALLIFIYGLILLRVAGRRIFQRAAALDIILAVLIGSNLSRALTNNAPFVPTLVASTVLVVAYWLMAYAAFRWEWLSWLTKGQATQLVAGGETRWRAMKRYGLTERDLKEAMRESGTEDVSAVKAAYIEPNGKISVIER